MTRLRSKQRNENVSAIIGIRFPVHVLHEPERSNRGSGAKTNVAVGKLSVYFQPIWQVALPMSMPGAIEYAYDMESYEMFLDASTVTAFEGCQISWAQRDDWRADGTDSTLFPGGNIPMKRVLINDGAKTYNIAAKYFALAHLASKLNGPSRWLLSLQLSLGDIVK